MDPQNYIRVSTILFLSLLLLHSPPRTEAKGKAKSPNDLIIDVCELSKSNEKFCLDTLRGNPKTATVKDHKGLAEISLEMMRELSTKASQKFRKLSRKHAATKQVTDECAKYFDETIHMLNLDGLEGGTASLDIHYASDNAQSCQTALTGAGVKIPTIAPTMQKWKNSFTIAISAVTTAEADVAPEY
ncbi:hypothetical protein M5689_024076 [Euphorbia peplus]|nr:hypothetical protein M5689_024076 [Euphorbia peplus]